jgi:hypothetical protein
MSLVSWISGSRNRFQYEAKLTYSGKSVQKTSGYVIRWEIHHAEGLVKGKKVKIKLKLSLCLN